MTLLYHANGKLMISGEYLVLNGVQALVLPLKSGQQLKVESFKGHNEPVIEWQANVRNSSWFSAVIGIMDWTIDRCTNDSIARRLVQYIRALGINSAVFTSSLSYKITTETDFDMNWGFGSSSALIANLAKWAGVDPFEFYFRITKGSGADLAAALSHVPVLYRLQNGKPVILPVKFRPQFYNKIWFIFLGQKQNTENSVNVFNTKAWVTRKHTAAIDRLTNELLQAVTVIDFENAVREHELLMGEILGKVRIKEERFSDFQGEVKSLGAWGGDFVMAVSGEDEESVRSYFKGKGLEIVMSFEEIIL